MTEKQRAAFEAALARSASKSEKREAVPTQRTRATMQGLTFGTADEIEARARALLTGREYSDVLDEIRGGLKAYKEARPIEAMAFEAGGALAPALLPIPGAQSSLARVAGRAALEGGAYAFGTGEGGAQERLQRVPGGAALGAAGGLAGQAAVKALGGVAGKLADSARRAVGGRGSTIVENEIQRLVAQTGKSPDEIAQDIIDGRLLAENRTIRAAVRSFRSGGGDASTTIERGMTGRPEAARAAAVGAMRKGMGSADAGSQVAAQRVSDQLTRKAERAAYDQFKGIPASDDVTEALADALMRAPSAAKEVEIALRAQTGAAPFFQIAEDGTFSFTRAPTIDEAESVRRAVKNRASSLYREGQGTAGEAVAGVEDDLRGALDFSIPELAATRGQAAAIRTNRDAYKAGTKALAGDVNEKLADFAELQQREGALDAVAAFRAGLMQAFEARATTGSRQSLIRNLTNAETKEGQLLREVFPQDQLGDVLRQLDIAVDAQGAKTFVLEGSPTAETLLENARQGMGINANEIAAVMGGNPVETFNVASKLIGRVVRKQLTDAEKAKIAEILVSTDPEMVRRAIVDESGMQQFANAVNSAFATMQNAARGAAVSQAAPIGGDVSQGLLSQN